MNNKRFQWRQRHVARLVAVLPWMLAVPVVAESAVAVGGASFDWSNPPQGVLEDRWFVVRINGQRAGYSRMATRRQGDEIESLNFVEMSIQRGPARIKMAMKSKQRETVEGKPLRFDVEQKMSLVNVKKHGVIRDGRVYITTTQQNRKTKADCAWDPKAKMSWAVALATRTKPVEVGQTYDLWVYDALAKPSGPIRSKVEIVGKEKVKLLDRELEAYKARTTSYLAGMPITSISYVDETGADVKMTMDMGFLKAELIACTEQQARQDAEPPELFVQTFIELPKPLHPARLQRVRYALRLGKQAEQDMFPSTAMQTVIKKSSKEIILDVARIDWEELKKAKAPATMPEDVKGCLQASSFLNAEDPEIIKLAKKAVGDAKDPVEQADRLRKFATDYVTMKDLNVGLGTASEVARSKQGDCTEHAVLLAAMARSIGIPARCVGGVVYISQMAGKRNIFGFHMWTQVWINGQWVDIDAAFRQTQCDPSHIAMSVMPLNEDGMTDLAAGILPFIGNTEIEVLETEPRAK